MEPNAKKPKLETSAEKLDFLGMYDDCITLVLEKLHKKDLCSISFVCQRLQGLAYALHMRKYPNKSITIEPIFDVKLRKFKVGFSENDEAYLKYMSKAVRNVEMQCTRNSIRDFFKFLKNKCCPNLKSLKIYRSRANLSSIPGKMIKDQLKNVESFSIVTLPAKRIVTPHKNWLTCCEKLRELSITTQYCNGEWLLDVYPELESLSIHLLKIDFDNECFAKYAPQFFERHPKIKEVKCVGYDTTKVILHNVNNIPRLIVKYKMMNLENIERIADEFKLHREKGRIEWLEFDLDHEIGEFDRLTEVDAVHPVQGLRTKLHGPIGQSMIEILKHLVHLELIVYVKSLGGPIDWTHLSKNLPHLETLKLSFEHTYQKFKSLMITMPFVRNMPKLKRFDVIADKSAIIENDHLVELNSARLLLKNPVHLQINIELLGNKCKLIIPISNILTTNIKQMKDIEGDEDSLEESSDDSSSDEDNYFEARYDSSDLESSSDSDSFFDSDSSSSSDSAPPFFRFLFGVMK